MKLRIYYINFFVYGIIYILLFKENMIFQDSNGGFKNRIEFKSNCVCECVY